MSTNLLSVIEQQHKALEHCVDAIVERGLNGSPEQARKWGLQLPLERAYAALAAARSVLANPTPSTTGEADEYQYRTKPTWDANAPWSDWTKCNRGSFEDYKRTPVHNDWIYEARALFAATPPQVEPAPSTDICRNCAGQGWEPSVYKGKVPCSFCQPAPSTAGERDRTIVSLPIPASASDLKSDIAELIQSHKYKGLRSIEVLGVFQFLGAEIISGSNS